MGRAASGRQSRPRSYSILPIAGSRVCIPDHGSHAHNTAKPLVSVGVRYADSVKGAALSITAGTGERCEAQKVATVLMVELPMVVLLVVMSREPQ